MISILFWVVLSVLILFFILGGTYKKTFIDKYLFIRYTDKNIKKLEQLDKGDWIDLPVHTDYTYKKGDTVTVSFEFAINLPEGMEAHILPRSSTFQNYGLLLTNSMGVIDNSYCGNNDIWKAKFYATKDGKINAGERVAQFRLMNNQHRVMWLEVDDLGTEDRGGYGSTGK